jgi:quinol monooxygenase YgiN
MVLIHVSVKAKEDSVGAFERTLREVVDGARRTAGCEKYDWYRAPDSSQGYVIYGEFDSKEHFETYLNSAVVQRIGAELMPLLAAKPEFKHYEASILEES